MCHKIYVLVKLGRLLLKSLQGKKFKERKGFTQIFLKTPLVNKHVLLIFLGFLLIYL